MEDWEHSSFRVYMDLQESALCNKNIMTKYIDLDIPTLYKDSYQVINFHFNEE